MEEKNLNNKEEFVFTGERFVPGIQDDQLRIEHFQRYNWVLPLVKDKVVLDIACGEGYGSNKMSSVAKQVIGVDVCEEAVQHAKQNYIQSNLEYKCGDIADIPVEDHSIDVLVSFETIEHVDEKLQNKFIKEAHRVLAPNGILVMSTPNKTIYSDKYDYHNEFHIKEFYKEEFFEFINNEFEYIHFYQQYEEVTNIITAEHTMKGQAVFYKDADKEAKYYIAVASNQPIEITVPSVLRNRKNSEYDQCINRILTLQKEEENRNNHIKFLDHEIEMKNQYIVQLQREVTDKDTMISKMRDKNTVQEYYDNQVERSNQIIHNFEDQVKIYNETISNLEQQIKLDSQSIHSLTQFTEKLDELISRHSSVIKEKDDKINELMNDKGQMKKQLDAQCAKNREMERLLDEQKSEVDSIKQCFDNERAELQQTIKNKEGHIELLLQSDRELDRIQHSKSWKLMKGMWKIARVIIPPNSKRRLFGGMVVKFITHPIRFLKACSPRKIKNFFFYLKKDGVNFVSARMEESLLGNEIVPAPIDLIAVASEEEKSKENYEKIVFAKVEEPQVSIIIPVYNQFEYTYLCLKSILQNTKDVTYEIIIADDNSTDITAHISEIVDNIKMVRNKENLRFLKNCNNASKAAEGKYIFFLNNDTQVQDNWLKPLVDLIESSDRIGMVGSKLVYPDGRLQEAGGILWKDGSAWNYGNRSDADSPEYNYIKEADYISGAAIMIKHDLWKEIGGFDERFTPAYCEDSDLAFEVRKHGYKVMYQPLSVVVHFEGISNGTDTNSGQKAYQVLNQQKFYEKWKDALEKEHFPNAYNVFQARDKSWKKKTLLMVDHYVPQYDKDAGSRTVFQYLKLFIDMGYNVKFIGDNFYKHEPYTTVLQQMGIEVLYGPYYAQNWKNWIKENREHIDYVFLNRPHISVKYIDFIRENTNAKIIYYGHDLHFLREYRKYELTGDKKALNDSNDWRQKEIALMRKADVVYYPSQIEVDEIAKIDPSIIARAIVAYIFNEVDRTPFNFEARKDVMFVGGFTHTPNVDAVIWLHDNILPIIRKKKPDIKFYIMGSNAPESILNLNSDNFIIKGFVTDEELADFYAKCRLDIVPLRYGAGIKGKVIEAMKYGMPVITTSVGAEGISGVENILSVNDDEEDIAQAIIDLYDNGEALTRMSTKSLQYIRDNFSPENAKRIIEQDFIV